MYKTSKKSYKIREQLFLVDAINMTEMLFSESFVKQLLSAKRSNLSKNYRYICGNSATASIKVSWKII